jgi:hypothetical protein
MSNKSIATVATMGIDIGKNSFHVVGLDQRGAIVLRQKWSRGQIEARLANIPPRLIGMEACVGAHHLSRDSKRLRCLNDDRRGSRICRSCRRRRNPNLVPPCEGVANASSPCISQQGGEHQKVLEPALARRSASADAVRPATLECGSAGSVPPDDELWTACYRISEVSLKAALELAKEVGFIPE